MNFHLKSLKQKGKGVPVNTCCNKIARILKKMKSYGRNENFVAVKTKLYEYTQIYL